MEWKEGIKICYDIKDDDDDDGSSSGEGISSFNLIKMMSWWQKKESLK